MNEGTPLLAGPVFPDMDDELHTCCQRTARAWQFVGINDSDALHSLISKTEGLDGHVEGSRPCCRERPDTTVDVRRVHLGDWKPLARSRPMLGLHVKIAEPSPYPGPESVIDNLVARLLSAKKRRR